jgi:hypothetical protein
MRAMKPGDQANIQLKQFQCQKEAREGQPKSLWAQGKWCIHTRLRSQQYKHRHSPAEDPLIFGISRLRKSISVGS